MKIFISWSGPKSLEIAKILREWIPNVIQVIEPYVSSEDIFKGERWSKDVSTELEAADFGIICVTRDNVSAPWIQFEAGALSKSIENARVCPFLFDVKISEISDPFKQFQATTFKKEDIKKLMLSINQTCPTGSLDPNRLDLVFETWWPSLENKLVGVREAFSSLEEPAPTIDDVKLSNILEEILELSRQQQLILTDKQRGIDSYRYLANDDLLKLHQIYKSLSSIYNGPDPIDKKYLFSAMGMIHGILENPSKILPHPSLPGVRKEG